MEKNIEYELEMLRSKKRKFTIIAIVCIATVIVLTAAAVYFKAYSNVEEKYQNIVDELEKQVQELSDEAARYTVTTKEVSIDLIKSEIKDIGELATIEYLYTDAGKFEDPKKLFDINIPFTTKSFIAKWNGVIKAGVKIDKVVVEVSNADKKIVVHIPKAEILSHEIDSNSIETLDQKDNIFNPIKVEDIREFDKISKEAMEQRAIENGILDKAFENAQGIIKKLINNDVVKEQGYIIEFQAIN